MQELPATWPRVMEIWWGLFWRSLVFILLPSFLFGAVLGVVFALNKIEIQTHLWKIQFVFGVFGLLVGIWLIKIMLGKTYSGFRIALLPASEGSESHPRG